MSFILWQDTMHTGNSKIDREHQDIIALINRLGDAIAEARWQSARIIGLRLFLEVCAHFADEEDLMKTSRYPEAGSHRRVHERCEHSMGLLDAALSWTDLQPDDVTAAFQAFSAQFDHDFFQADLRLVSFLASQRT